MLFAIDTGMRTGETQRDVHHYPESLRNRVEVLDIGGTTRTNSAQGRLVHESGSVACWKLVPPTRIERATNGLGISGKGIAQVIDDMGDPLVVPAEEQLSRFGSFRITSPVSRQLCTSS